MDFLKNNLFYVILVGAVLVISIPSYMLAAQRRGAYEKARSDAVKRVGTLEKSAAKVTVISPLALTEAEQYRKAWEEQRESLHRMLEASDRHMDVDFLIAPPAPGETPDPEQYKIAYKNAYDQLSLQLSKAGLADARTQPLPKAANFENRVPTPAQIRISQKQYWILKELVDLFSDPDSGVKAVTSVTLDYVPNATDALNGPDSTKTFWRFPMRLEFQMDFRYFPVLLEKLLENKNVMLMPDGYFIERAFDPSKPVYVPLVQVSLYCEAWDYISTEFEKKNLEDAEAKKGKGGAAGGK